MGGGQSLLAAAADAAKNNCVELDWSNRRTDDNPKLVTIVPPSFVSHLLGSTLTDLRLSGNGIAQLPASFGRLVALEYDSITSFVGIPTFSELTSLQRLWLHHNRLETLPPALGDLQALERVFVQHNVLSALPFSIVLLTELDASDNKICMLPEEWQTAPAVTTLRLTRNLLKQLPIGLGALQQLHTFNRIDKFPAAALDGMRLLRVLTYTQNKYVVGINFIPLHSLNAVDATLFHLTKLVYLDLSENGLVQLPDDDDSDPTASSSTNDANHGTWACLACLQEFHVSNNRLSRLPRGLEALPALHFLNVSNNALVEVCMHA
ncbi:hypothetical protein DYB37_011118 [Aphanomyces astaci]|uniref:Uncharacterized protein n=1 Tax=Aphanomyces astaci TaxID=112090 RepID=A0A3R6XGD8_APHAT|nr:hypothetical protein DYB37_011118 [Aphanomyces astaci]